MSKQNIPGKPILEWACTVCGVTDKNELNHILGKASTAYRSYGNNGNCRFNSINQWLRSITPNAEFFIKAKKVKVSFPLGYLSKKETQLTLEHIFQSLFEGEFITSEKKNMFELYRHFELYRRPRRFTLLDLGNLLKEVYPTIRLGYRIDKKERIVYPAK